MHAPPSATPAGWRSTCARWARNASPTLPLTLSAAAGPQPAVERAVSATDLVSLSSRERWGCSGGLRRRRTAGAAKSEPRRAYRPYSCFLTGPWVNRVRSETSRREHRSRGRRHQLQGVAVAGADQDCCSRWSWPVSVGDDVVGFVARRRVSTRRGRATRAGYPSAHLALEVGRAGAAVGLVVGEQSNRKVWRDTLNATGDAGRAPRHGGRSGQVSC